MKTWVRLGKLVVDDIERDLTFINKPETYSICKNTCVVVSHPRKTEFGKSIVNVKLKVLAISSKGHVSINAWTSINVKKKYKEVYGIEWEG